MKTLNLLIALTFFGFSVFAQQEASSKKTETIKILTSAVCGMCKDKIEITLYGLKGVKSATLDVPSKVVTVKYKPADVTPEQLRTAISLSGYDANEIPADPQAYEKLHACCKKGAH
ncbi:MAG: heavy metal-associated domain-containing protein [Chitinophagales bacterium]|nr:heavy metal-associated domain-containing protein [Chitinophagales bacterium]